MARFNVSYEIVTPDSAEFGDAESRGFICESAPLRDAIADLFATRTCRVGGVDAIEANDSRAESARWITVYNSAEYETGANESRSLHFPESISAPSRARLVRLVTGKA